MTPYFPFVGIQVDDLTMWLCAASRVKPKTTRRTHGALVADGGVVGSTVEEGKSCRTPAILELKIVEILCVCAFRTVTGTWEQNFLHHAIERLHLEDNILQFLQLA